MSTVYAATVIYVDAEHRTMIVSPAFCFRTDCRFEERKAMPAILGSPELLRNTESDPKDILFDEIRRTKPSLTALGIRFSVSRLTVRMKGGRPKKPPYFACCYNLGNLGNGNIVAFYHPLIADWYLMGKKGDEYRQRIRSAIREEIIHSVQVITVKNRYE